MGGVGGDTKCNAVGFPWKEHGVSREVRSNDARMRSNAVGCDSKRLFSVLSQPYQSYMYMRCETIQRLVHGKRKHKTDTILLTSVHEIALVNN